jgi:glutamate-1-semialdehyde aminotransferase
VTATAGLTALEAYDEAEVERINDLGETLAEMIRSAGDNRGIGLQVNQFGSLFKVYLANDPIENYRDSLQSASDLEKELYFELLSEGIRLAPKLMGALSTPMTEDEINECADAFDTALERLRPQIEARAPHLVEN